MSDVANFFVFQCAKLPMNLDMSSLLLILTLVLFILLGTLFKTKWGINFKAIFTGLKMSLM